MVAYSFKGRFAAPIEARTKRQTIRQVGKKRHTRPGERMTMTTGDRFHPKPIGSATCISVDAIVIDIVRGTISLEAPAGVHYIIAGELDTFAQWDGFEDWADMVAFWRSTHPGVERFEGIRIFWGDTFVPATPPAGD